MKLKAFWLGLGSLMWLTQPVDGAVRPFYTSDQSIEARFEFVHQVEFESDVVPNEDLAMRKIDDQVAYMYGSMGSAQYKAGPKDDYQIWDIVVTQKSDQQGLYVASYRYEGTIVLDEGHRGDTYGFDLPVNPERVYDAAQGKSIFARGNYCIKQGATNDRGSFFYYFNPRRSGCALKEGRDYLRVVGKVQRFANTVLTYPEYDRLVDATGTIRIDVLMGMNHESHSWDGLTSKDSNGVQYRKMRTDLRNQGFAVRKLSAQEAAAAAHVPVSQAPFIEEFRKDTRRGKVVIRMFFGPTSLDGGNSKPFHYLFKEALEKASIVMYGGHSGLGANADLQQIEEMEGFKIRMNPRKYQILLFNSCSSYTAYVSGFQARKAGSDDPRGTKSLDILGTGLVNYFHLIGKENSRFLRAILDWAEGRRVPSYQQIVKELDDGNFFSVSGDEDNPTSAP